MEKMMRNSKGNTGLDLSLLVGVLVCGLLMAYPHLPTLPQVVNPAAVATVAMTGGAR